MTIGLLAALATVAVVTGASIERADAQMQQVTDGFNPSDPQWALGNPFMSSGWGAGSSMNQPAYTAPLGSGMVGLSVASYGVNATGGNFFSPSLAFPTSQQPNWLPNFGSASVTSVVGNYKSAPNAALFGGLYTTASFGITSISTNPAGFSGLPNFTAGNDAVGFSAKAGLGLQLTPQITIEGSVGVTQMPTSTLR
ncbi:MAG: hypothetical protein ABI192_19660 [Bradyrhizobium sp.]